ncbi:uncharacterized protein BDZ99DRAFT_517074 [Mytilinidion resinicola]|uniref:Uncharacterized protein n=1 Tax=Mytilinidion resinicola TaxID=574789 RepID=A0A6A6Z2M6_9PEZI|nr:uncharacterized protein BDZ99DRAFT_517074 [Mytilinidion resinicola]KAF2814487.1 hypothetical protein BDZ99DRAFT_517074 [Mytilinidion resinicola]
MEIHQRDSSRHKPGVTESPPSTGMVTALTQAAAATTPKHEAKQKQTREAVIYVLGLGMTSMSIEDQAPDGTAFRRIEGGGVSVPPKTTTAKGKTADEKQAAQPAKKEKKKKKKKKKDTGREVASGSRGVAASAAWYDRSPSSYDMFDEDQNWGLCDKDCGWCGHCMDGLDI